MTQEFKPKPANPQTTASSDQAPRDEIIRDMIKSRVKTFNPFRRSRIIEWNANIAYLCGHQYIGLSGGNIVRRTNLSPFASVVNKIAPAVRNDVALATKIPPKFDVVPDTTDENDKATAVAAEKMLSYLRRLNDFDTQRGKIILWYDISNIGWRKQWWNPFYKVIGQNPESEQMGHNPEMEAGAPVYQGEAISEFVPTNELVYDWRQNTSKLPWIIHATTMTKSEARVRWKEKVDAIPDSEFVDPTAGKNEFEIKLFNEFEQFVDELSGTTVKVDTEEMGAEDKLITVYELWQIRDANYPAGIFAILAGLENGVVMQNAPYPIEQYPHGEIPFTAYDMMLPDRVVAGTASRISQARPLQSELNDIRTLIRENTCTLGGGLWKVPRESKLNISRIDNGPGLMVEYDGPYEPHREQGVPVSGQLFVYQQEIVKDINDIFSFPMVAQGKRPVGGPKSGVGIALLQEASQTQHSPIISEMEKKDESAIRQLLSIAFANYGERTLNIIGKDNEWTMFEFSPESFHGKFNVNIRTGSSMPISRAIERELALMLFQQGVLGNPMDPTVRKRVLETIDIGGLDRILKENNKDVNFAKKEFQVPVKQYHQMIQAGVSPDEAIKGIYLPAVNPFDNHEVHIIEHKNDLLDKFFEYLGTGDPGLIVIANAMQAHWMQHSEILAEQQIRQAIATGQIKREDLESSEEKESAKPSPSRETGD
jgi:hypothetical protein